MAAPPPKPPKGSPPPVGGDPGKNAPPKKEPRPESDIRAIPTKSTVLVNGEAKTFEAYNIGGSNFFKLRDLAFVLNETAKQFAVNWDGAQNAITLEQGKAYTPTGEEMAVSGNTAVISAKRTASTIIIDSEQCAFTAYNIGGNNYFKLRDLAERMNFGVTWDGQTNTIGIDTSIIYSTDGANNSGDGSGGSNNEQRNNSHENWENRDFYPDTEEAPVLELTWDGGFNPQKATRYGPFGVWENANEDEIYQPEPEMEIHCNSPEIDYLAVACGTVVNVMTGGDPGKQSDANGQITVRYGKNYAVVYYHIKIDPSIQKGQRIETGQKIGTMPTTMHEAWGEEVMWEISVVKYFPDTGLTRVVPPYDYFSDEGKTLLDGVVENSKEKIVGCSGPNAWTVTQGFSWVPYIGEPAWYSHYAVLGYKPEGTVEEKSTDFIRAINPTWREVEGGCIIGPTDILVR